VNGREQSQEKLCPRSQIKRGLLRYPPGMFGALVNRGAIQRDKSGAEVTVLNEHSYKLQRLQKLPQKMNR